MHYIQIIYSLLDKNTRHQLFLLVIFSILISIVETVGISAIMPFVDVATNFENIHQNPYYQWLFHLFNFEREISFAIAFGFVLFVFYIFRGGINLLYNYLMANFTAHLYAHVTKKLFKAYLSMPYQVFTHKNSSYLTKSIITEASLMSEIIHGALLLVSEILVIAFLYILMLLVSWEITLVLSIILAIKIVFLTQTISPKIKLVGKTRAKVQAQFYEMINRLFGDFKNIKLQNRARLDATHLNFAKAIDQYANANATHTYLTSFPRLFLETSGFFLIIALLTSLLYINQSDVSYILPVLSLFVLTLYRLLPSANRIVSGYNLILYYHRSIDIVDEGLSVAQESFQDEVIEFNRQIDLKNVSFSYREQSVLNNINLTIHKGDKVAFIGKSGSGKSTIVDLIIGLYQTDQGEIRIDDSLLDESNLQHWRSQIGYIPQQVYLFDGTIAENVCFGRSLNKDLLNKVLKQANIFDFLQTKQGTETLVGEKGIQLSGGQRQRIAIARALYGRPKILVLDEATSALDEKTEQNIMDEIYQISQNKTLIIVAHRLSTIRSCDRIYELKDGIVSKKDMG